MPARDTKTRGDMPAPALALGLVSTVALARQTGHADHMAGRTAIHARSVARHHQPRSPRAGCPGPPVPSSCPSGDRTARYARRGYVFVPRKGIPGAHCDMPTSTCPNEPRDTR